MDADWIVPEWPAPANVRALCTTRNGGVSLAPFDSLNLGTHVGDAPDAVARNRRIATRNLPSRVVWLEQVHGTRVVDLDEGSADQLQADAAVCRQPGSACVVMTADCLPVLFCNEVGTVVAAAHAGWRGLLDGVLEATIRAMDVPPERIMSWLGPAIGPDAFEVGEEVRDAFVSRDASAISGFRPGARAGKWWADIYWLARQRLAANGVRNTYGGGLCTVSDPARFHSYRRDGVSGRMGAFVWLESSA